MAAVMKEAGAGRAQPAEVAPLTVHVCRAEPKTEEAHVSQVSTFSLDPWKLFYFSCPLTERRKSTAQSVNAGKAQWSILNCV